MDDINESELWEGTNESGEAWQSNHRHLIFVKGHSVNKMLETNDHVLHDIQNTSPEHITDGLYPKLIVTYECSYEYKKDGQKIQCTGRSRLDVYGGPPKCHGTYANPHPGMWMKPLI